MPIEKSLQRSRPSQARDAGVPRAIEAADELEERAVAPDQEMRRDVQVRDRRVSTGARAGSSRLVKRRTMPSPPNSPGGSEMPCTTTSVTGVSGRARVAIRRADLPREVGVAALVDREARAARMDPLISFVLPSLIAF